MKKRLKIKTLKKGLFCSHYCCDIRTTCDWGGGVIFEEYSYCRFKHEDCVICKSFTVSLHDRNECNKLKKLLNNG